MSLHRFLFVNKVRRGTKHILLAIVLLNTSSANSQAQKPGIRKADSIVEQTKELRLKKLSPDTPSTHFSYSFSVDKIGKGNTDMKITMSKDSSESSYLKYLFPILTLLLGIVVNKVLDYLKDRKNYKKSANRWIAEVASMDYLITEQIEYLKEFQLELAKEKYQLEKFGVIQLLNGEVFKALDKSDLLNYLEHVKKKDFSSSIAISNHVNGFINILPERQKKLLEIWEAYLKETSSLNTSFSTSLNDLSKAIGGYMVEIEIELGDPQKAALDGRLVPIFKLYDAHVKPKAEGGGFDVFELEEKFFGPMQGIMAALRHDKRSKEMSDLVAACLTAAKRLRYERDYLRENVQTIIDWYKESQGEIPGIVHELKL